MLHRETTLFGPANSPSNELEDTNGPKSEALWNQHLSSAFFFFFPPVFPLSNPRRLKLSHLGPHRFRTCRLCIPPMGFHTSVRRGKGRSYR